MKVFLAPADNWSTEMVRQIMDNRQIEYTELSVEYSDKRWPNLFKPYAIINGHIYEGLDEISRGLSYHRID